MCDKLHDNNNNKFVDMKIIFSLIITINMRLKPVCLCIRGAVERCRGVGLWHITTTVSSRKSFKSSSRLAAARWSTTASPCWSPGLLSLVPGRQSPAWITRNIGNQWSIFTTTSIICWIILDRIKGLLTTIIVYYYLSKTLLHCIDIILFYSIFTFPFRLLY